MRCWAGIFAIVFFVALVVGSFIWHLRSQTVSPALATVKIDPQKITVLMRYHGAQIARFQNGSWYFLARNGRWLPLETKEACRYLTARFHHKDDAPCL